MNKYISPVRFFSDDNKILTNYICSIADVHAPEIRSYNMSRTKGKNTKPEMLVRSFLHTNGFRYKLHDKSLPGKADIACPAN